jgi:myo-inositol-1-phosphate synthase
MLRNIKMRDNIKIALVGIGNCASALIQGISYYNAHPNEIIGLIKKRIGRYKVSDIKIVAAFDVDSDKVSKDVSEAILLGKNNVTTFSEVTQLGTTVSAAPVLDGLGEKYREMIPRVEDGSGDEVLDILRRSKAEIIVNYLPVGSFEATRWWADVAIRTGCAFINCIPEFIASDPIIAERFIKARLPLIGDDVKSQFGATLLHRIIVQHMERRGLVIDKTYQLNFGGNMDFYNMLNENRLHSKRVSKRESVRSMQKVPLKLDNIHIGPSDYVSWLEDNKWCYIHLQGRGFGGVPLRLEAKLEVCDSPNSAGVVVDLIRCAKIALSAKLSGPINEVCSYYMKSPPIQLNEDDAFALFEKWLINTTSYQDRIE